VTSPRLAAHLAVGEATARAIERDIGLQPGSIERLYHGVADVRRDAPAQPGTIVNVARHDPVKGVDVAIRAMEHVRTPVRLVQIGGGELLEEHRRLVHELGLDERVEVRGEQWDDRVADSLSAYDLFVLSSHTEGMPATVMEAMLAGLPIVASDVGSLREAVTPGVNGQLVPPGDPRALAAAIDEVLEDPARRAEMGAASRRTAEAMFTMGSTVAAYCEVYRRVLASR
jgi:glycosyltransferase involved in cell wall biosynthesis